MNAMDREARLRRDALIGAQSGVGVGYDNRSTISAVELTAGCLAANQSSHRSTDHYDPSYEI